MPALNPSSPIVFATPERNKRVNINTSLGNANILAELLPQLHCMKIKPWEKLQQVDHYMLEETEEMCRRIKTVLFSNGD